MTHEYAGALGALNASNFAQGSIGVEQVEPSLSRIAARLEGEIGAVMRARAALASHNDALFGSRVEGTGNSASRPVSGGLIGGIEELLERLCDANVELSREIHRACTLA